MFLFWSVIMTDIIVCVLFFKHSNWWGLVALILLSIGWGIDFIRNRRIVKLCEGWLAEIENAWKGSRIRIKAKIHQKDEGEETN